MQQRDQPRAAFVDKAKFLGDPGTDVARRAREGRPLTQAFKAPRIVEGVILLELPPTSKWLRPSTPLCSNTSSYQPRDRVVVEQENLGHLLTAHPLIQQHQGVGAPCHATGGQTVASQISALRSSSIRKPPRIMRPSESDPTRQTQDIFPESSPIESRVYPHAAAHGRRHRRLAAPHGEWSYPTRAWARATGE